MGMFSLVLLSTSIGITLGLVAGGLLMLIGLVSKDTFWLIVQGCTVLGFVAGAFVILRIRLRSNQSNTGSNP
jgi:hypothetical protein